MRSLKLLAHQADIAQIRQEAAARAIFRVAYIVAGHHRFAGEFTTSGHNPLHLIVARANTGRRKYNTRQVSPARDAVL